MSSAVIRAAGGVLWRCEDKRGLHVALVHRPRYDDWSLPKGKADPGEHLLACALREVKEETGYDAVAGRPLGTSRYLALAGGRPLPKIVSWWAMRATGGGFEATREVDEMLWLRPDDALRRMTGTRGRSALRRFLRASPSTRTLLLVRNARAPSRSQWTGDEAARPLHPAGGARADELARLLSAYQPDVIASAAALRCVETVTPLAKALGLPVEIEPALGAAAHAGDSSRALTRVQDLLAGRTSVAVCGEREVIRGLLAGLTGQRQPTVGRGSAWALSLDGGRLTGVDYWAG
ncbi:MAG: 8-oxo-(d)GTP phosphatase [Mycobacteriales bacterium]